MTNAEDDLLGAFEIHSVDAIRGILDGGLDANAPVRGKSPIEWLLEMYTRSDRFPLCVRILLDRGARLSDPALGPILLDDVAALIAMVRADASVLTHRTNLVSAFTPLMGASLLHVAAEYGNFDAAKCLIDLGADVEVRAAMDADGFGGHTPLFHTVNSNGNRSMRIMRLLLDAGARPDLRVDGLTWGKGFDWETTFFDLTPISYAQLGLLPQMHPDEREIGENVQLLLAAAGRKVPPLRNVPNRYLRPRV